jgi:hypothetical protein
MYHKSRQLHNHNIGGSNPKDESRRQSVQELQFKSDSISFAKSKPKLH